MGALFDKITDWINTMLRDGITNNFAGMYDELNSKVAEISNEVGKTPESWNSSIFSIIKNISETIIVPIAGIILTFVLCYELITMVIEKNNMSDFDPANIYKWIFKTFIAVYILTHTFAIVVGVFDVAQHAVSGTVPIIEGSLDPSIELDDLTDQLEGMETGELIGLYIESAILSLAIKAIALCVFIIIYGRMIEIYLTCSIAPIPFSTMVNREWGHIGNSYLKGLFALGFQGFLIMVCVAIYAALLGDIASSSNIHIAVWSTMGYTLLLCLSLFKTGSLSKSLFGSH